MRRCSLVIANKESGEDNGATTDRDEAFLSGSATVLRRGHSVILAGRARRGRLEFAGAWLSQALELTERGIPLSVRRMDAVERGYSPRGDFSWRASFNNSPKQRSARSRPACITTAPAFIQQGLAIGEMGLGVSLHGSN